MAGQARTKIAQDMDIIEKNAFRFCWIVDFPMFEYDEENKKVDFSHNPFSMPQGGLKALEEMDPLTIKAYQYDIVCNGIELSSGAIRNHLPEVMYKAFAIAGYPAEELEAALAGCSRPLSWARRLTEVLPPVLTASSCSWLMNPIFARSLLSR